MNEDQYLHAIVGEFRQTAEQSKGFELRKKLWHSAVIVCELSPDRYKDWQLTLADIALNAGLKPTEIISTVRSARRKAGAE